LTGLYTPERQLVGFGTVTYQLGFLGDDEGGEAELTQEVTASYLPIPGHGAVRLQRQSRSC
jgi:hypothetical protein